jgi:DNA-directed RNA polymerase subunit K/omega
MAQETDLIDEQQDGNVEPPDIDSKYRMIILAAQRSKQLQRGALPRVDADFRRKRSISRYWSRIKKAGSKSCHPISRVPPLEAAFFILRAFAAWQMYIFPFRARPKNENSTHIARQLKCD